MLRAKYELKKIIACNILNFSYENSEYFFLLIKDEIDILKVFL